MFEFACRLDQSDRLQLDQPSRAIGGPFQRTSRTPADRSLSTRHARIPLSSSARRSGRSLEECATGRASGPSIARQIRSSRKIVLRLRLTNRASAIASAGAFHSGGCLCSTRVRCRMVNRMRGRYLVMRSKIRRALSKLLPANTRSSTCCPSRDHCSTL